MLGPFAAEGVRTGQRAISADHNQAIDPLLEQVMDGPLPTRSFPEFLRAGRAGHSLTPVQDPKYPGQSP